MDDVLKGNWLIERLLEQAMSGGGGVDVGCPCCGMDGLTIKDLGDLLLIKCGVCGWECVEDDDDSMIGVVQQDKVCHPSF